MRCAGDERYFVELVVIAIVSLLLDAVSLVFLSDRPCNKPKYHLRLRICTTVGFFNAPF
jgi:hypothetical protein